jgi:hypothetical protein
MTDYQLIELIAQRASAMYARIAYTKVPSAFIASELYLVHREIVPLRLQEMLDADDSNFAHDIGGIHSHLRVGNPSVLMDCFLPRYAKV